MRALSEQGVISLSLDAANLEEARERAARQGLTILHVRGESRLFTRRRAFPLLLFSQEMLSLLRAGLGLIEALETLVDKEHDTESRTVISKILERLYEGRTLSAALEQMPQTFPPIYIAAVRASERTSDLPEALSRYVAFQGQVEQLRSKVVSACIYPIVLLLVGGAVTLFLLGYVVPKFSAIYADMGADMPFLSRVLVGWGGVVAEHGLASLIVIAVLIAMAAVMLRRPDVRAMIGRRLWSIPAVGSRLRVYQLARFYRTVGMLLRGGVPVLQAVNMSAGLLSAALRPGAEAAAAGIRTGLSISQALDDAKLTTPVALRMLRVGERSGNMGDMMERAAAFHDEEMSRWVDWATRLFEPLLMVLIGLIIGLIVVLLYMPIFDLAGNLR
ncbi:MAG: type II secretion system F family protein [Burkholderiales bacterium]